MSEPALTAAIVVGGLRRRAQRAVDAIAAQEGAGEIELLLVDTAHDAAPITLPPSVRGVHVALPDALLADAKLEAVRRASGPIVAFVEDHCYPEPGWAAALVEAFRGPWAAVGYTFVNANPDSWASRSAMFADYGIFAHPHPGGESAQISGNNVAYRRDALLPLGDRLGNLLVVDFNLHEALRARGGRLFIASGAVTAHENYVTIHELSQANRSYCRVMAGIRARRWSPARRWFYALTTPLGAPAIKLARVVRSVVARPHLLPQLLSSAPVVAICFAWAAAGEARGYLDRDTRAADRDFRLWELDTVRATAG
jgi:hypothetical protein